MEYLTAKQVAEELGVSAGRVRQLVAENRLPATKFGNSLMILESDLELVRERKKTGRPPKDKDEK
ncbi:MAG: helix-turn-helix domain-containing protein [Acidobacteria bacterium]|jgi:excisionase family DNA binding protein|nr:helix-turn-helix domain-containing protein [Acidobacteriota bacterium]